MSDEEKRGGMKGRVAECWQPRCGGTARNDETLRAKRQAQATRMPVGPADKQKTDGEASSTRWRRWRRGRQAGGRRKKVSRGRKGTSSDKTEGRKKPGKRPATRRTRPIPKSATALHRSGKHAHESRRMASSG